MADDASITPAPQARPHKPAKPLSARLSREMLEAAVERLLGAVDGILADLDDHDGDPDLEEEPDLEPSSGDPHQVVRIGRTRIDIDDAEHNGLEPPEDHEYDLGSTNSVNQERWCRESSCESYGGGCVVDGEPVLSASEDIDQRRWVNGDRRDLEEQCEDEGVSGYLDPDAEPWLGWTNDHQISEVAPGTLRDAEEQCEDEGFDCDREPNDAGMGCDYPLDADGIGERQTRPSGASGLF